MAQDALNDVNIFAVFRFILSYPDERHLAYFGAGSLNDLRTLYVRLFEAGLPQPECPLLESHYVENRPSTEVVLENKLFYQHFGLAAPSRTAPDSLLTQLEFLSWIEHCRAAGNGDDASLGLAREQFIGRHLRHAAKMAWHAREAGGGCYAEALEQLAAVVGAAAS